MHLAMTATAVRRRDAMMAMTPRAVAPCRPMDMIGKLHSPIFLASNGANLLIDMRLPQRSDKK